MKERKVTTQEDIARSLGISRGTVDRALHNREGISGEVKRQILSRAEQLGYAPNRFAQFLVTGRQINIVMITPGDPFWTRVHEGANSFLSELSHWLVQVRWLETAVHDPQGEVGLFQEALSANVDGIGVAPSDPDLLAPWIDRAVESGIPVVTLNTDAPTSRRLLFIGQDPISAGKTAAELLGKFLGGRGKIAVLTGLHSVLVHRLRLSSFQQAIASDFPGIAIEGVYDSHDTDRDAYAITRGLLARECDIDGIYLTTGTGLGGVGRALRASGKAGLVKVVCFDFLSDTVELLKEGVLSATIGEDPYNQGYQTVKAIYDYIVDKKRPATCFLYTRMDIGLKANIDLLASHGSAT